MRDIIDYIIRFLIGTEQAGRLSSCIGYTSDKRLFDRYLIVFTPSGFFNEGVYGTQASIPTLPLQDIEGVPLLFGSPKIEWVGDTLLIHADLIASTYFLLTRYEEIVRRTERDDHGRFPGKLSLPFRAGFIERPIVEEYGVLVRQWLRMTTGSNAIHEPEPQLQKLWLTHDVDAPLFCQSLRHVARETLKGMGLTEAWKLYLRPEHEDPYYTFPWLLEQGQIVRDAWGEERCQTLFFLKGGGNAPQDKPYYPLNLKLLHRLSRFCSESGGSIGLHSSYSASLQPNKIIAEKRHLERATGFVVTYNRHHYLACREPEDLNTVEKAGFSDDFTMGYADVAGFRLGTCRPVHWINPITKRISDMQLHPLACMDATLGEAKYMGLNEQEAVNYVLRLAQNASRHGGELVLLWHNDRVSEFSSAKGLDYRRVFQRILSEIVEQRL